MRTLPYGWIRASTPVMLAALVLVACGGRTVRTTATEPSTVDVSQLWREPVDLENRDLFIGPAADAPRPDTATPFVFLKEDRSGFSPGYDVRDTHGLEWNVKLGVEAQPEVVVSRILWAIGYHQLPTYYVTDWRMQGGPDVRPGPARFRPELPHARVVGEWAWHENPFTHLQPFRGLIVANLIVNNWDWKASNNRVYDFLNPDGTGVRRYIVRDLGASLGKTDAPPISRLLGARIAQGNRNNLEDFEAQGFVKGVDGNRVEFDYEGIYQSIVDIVTPDDVVWTCRLLARLSDEQWQAAFTAGGYSPDQASRYIAKLKSKIAEGLALGNASSARAS